MGFLLFPFLEWKMDLFLHNVIIIGSACQCIVPISKGVVYYLTAHATIVREIVGHSHGTSHRRRTGHSSKLFPYQNNIMARQLFTTDNWKFWKKLTAFGAMRLCSQQHFHSSRTVRLLSHFDCLLSCSGYWSGFWSSWIWREAGSTYSDIRSLQFQYIWTEFCWIWAVYCVS